MPLFQNGETLFQNLRAELLRFKQASPLDRIGMLRSVHQNVTTLPLDIDNPQLAINVYTKMAYEATLINYANALYRIEQCDFFDILIDFKMPDLFKKESLVRLNDYFEFHPQAPQMKLKVRLEDIPMDIWQLFREAQKEKLKIDKKEDKFNLDELDIHHLPVDQLYPLPIQMFGRYENEAVDRVWASAKGEYQFANPFGVFLLPGGGMIEIKGLEKTLEAKRLKMLDEHLEEQHANLYDKAAISYNELSQDEFMAVLRHCTIENSQLKSDYQDALRVALFIPATDLSNAAILQNVIKVIDDLLEKPAADKQALHALRATVQVEPFKRTLLYHDAAQYVEKNSIMVNIEQLGDTRACGGKQTSHAYLMFSEDLLAWFKRAFHGVEAETGDDIRGSQLVKMTLLEAIANFSKVKFSHLLIVLAHQIESLERGCIALSNVWNNDQYRGARSALAKAAEDSVKLIELGYGLVVNDAKKAEGVRGGFFTSAEPRLDDSDAKQPRDSKHCTLGCSPSSQ